MRQYAPFFVAFALLWVLQLYGTAKQSQQFMRAVRDLRPLGETAIGASSNNRMKRRAYVAIAADQTDVVTGAVELGGLTVFARAEPVAELVGVPLRDLADSTANDRRSRAAAMAARALLGEDLEGGSSVADGAAPTASQPPPDEGGAEGETPQTSVHRSTGRSSTHLPSRPAAPPDLRD
jgi:DNA-binding transcriptional regulator of glucitol operon